MNQHFVPRSYLKHFARQKNDDFYVDVFDKKTSNEFETNIKNICSQKDYYNLPENSKHKTNKLAIEKFYSDFAEPIYSEAFKILSNDEITSITDLQRVKIIIGVFQFYFRNPKILNESLKVHFDNIDILLKEAQTKNQSFCTYLGIEFNLKDFDSESIKKSIKKKVVDSIKDSHIDYTGALSTEHEFGVIEVFKSDGEHYFITNDCPLEFKNVLKKSNQAIFDKASEFTFPISEKYAVKISHNKNKQPFKLYRQEINEAEVALINNSVISQATRFVIGSQETFKKQQEFDKIFNDTNPKKKVDLLKNLLSVVPETDENKTAFSVFQKLINAFESNGCLSESEIILFDTTMENLVRKNKQSQLK